MDLEGKQRFTRIANKRLERLCQFSARQHATGFEQLKGQAACRAFQLIMFKRGKGREAIA